jgi:DNA-binding NtrC family response regulator
MKAGAYDYVVKPIHMDSIRVTIRNALESMRLTREVQQLQETFLRENLPCLVGESKVIQDIMSFVEKIADSPDTPVLIQGETGTGKELLAGAIHYRSPNFRGPLVTLNCASLQKDLIESELFGYEKGAFTGASEQGKKGLIEQAENGTLFLDEIGDLSPEAQSKLLRFLENSEFYRVGGTSPQKVAARIVSATNRDLSVMVEEGAFRKDLYFRLSVVRLDLPSLSERKEDILPLAEYFLVEFSRKFGKKTGEISPEARKALLEHDWTGNIRELRNVIERAVLLCGGEILGTDCLGLNSPAGPGTREDTGFTPLTEDGVDFPSLQKEFEAHYLTEALRMTGGNEAKAARLLNMNHHTYRYRLKKYLK